VHLISILIFLSAFLLFENIFAGANYSYFWLIGNCSLTLHTPIISMMSFIGKMTVADIFDCGYYQGWKQSSLEIFLGF